MATWHFVLYSGAAILALRSFVQLATNYRHEFEHEAVTSHLTRMAEELKTGTKQETANRTPEKSAAPSEQEPAAVG